MKRRFFTLATIFTLSGSLLFSSCIGSFGLFNKLLAWNQTIDNKFVNELVFVVMTPAYAISYLADVLVLNSIEFWSGENPVAAGIVKEVQGENGIYTVETLENGYRIENEEGQAVNLIYDKESNTWSAVTKESTTKLIKMEEDNKVIVYLPGGVEKEVELTQQGALAFRQSVENAMYLATR